jgi:hypothetical protein
LVDVQGVGQEEKDMFHQLTQDEMEEEEQDQPEKEQDLGVSEAAKASN